MKLLITLKWPTRLMEQEADAVRILRVGAFPPLSQHACDHREHAEQQQVGRAPFGLANTPTLCRAPRHRRNNLRQQRMLHGAIRPPRASRQVRVAHDMPGFEPPHQVWSTLRRNDRRAYLPLPQPPSCTPSSNTDCQPNHKPGDAWRAAARSLGGVGHEAATEQYCGEGSLVVRRAHSGTAR